MRQQMYTQYTQLQTTGVHLSSRSSVYYIHMCAHKSKLNLKRVKCCGTVTSFHAHILYMYIHTYMHLHVRTHRHAYMYSLCWMGLKVPLSKLTFTYEPPVYRYFITIWQFVRSAKRMSISDIINTWKIWSMLPMAADVTIQLTPHRWWAPMRWTIQSSKHP